MFHCLSLRVLLLISIIFLQSNAAQALMLDMQENGEFSLNLERVTTDLKFDNAVIENRISRIYMSIYEASYAWFQPGLKLGYLSSTQSNNPITAGINLSGEIIGISLITNIPPRRFLSTQIEMDYLYHDVNKETFTQKVSLKWYEFIAKAGVSINPGLWQLSIGRYFHLIDGDETAYGTIIQTRHFKEEKQTGSYLDFTLFVDSTGKVGIRAQGGSRRGINLVFSREY
ncbi:MAG: hypothetical protein GXP19_00565 [Gammaproteobacteria bacterium]|nr:hypothetical protein [Gammaproteobacteria bacterium]